MNFLLTKASISSLNTAITSLYSHQIPRITEKLCLCIDYFQLFSLIIVVSENPTNDSTVFSSFVVPFLKLFCPGFLIHLQHNPLNTLIAWFFVMIMLFLLKYVFLAYTICLAFKKERLTSGISRIWSWIFLIQGRIIFAFIGSLCSSVSKMAINTEGISDGWKYSITAISISLLIIEGTFCLIQTLVYSCYLPNKQFLTSKTSQVEVITLMQKGIILLLFVFLREMSATTKWIFVIGNFLISIFRNATFYRTLPPYNLKAIHYQGVLISIATSLSLCYLTKEIANRAYTNGVNDTFLPVLFVVLALVIAKAHTEFLSNKIRSLYMSSTDFGSSVETLLQKIIVIKTIRKQRKQSAENATWNDWSDLIFNAINNDANDFFNVNQNWLSNPTNPDLNIAYKEDTNRAFSLYLESIISKYPRNRLAKLHLAYYYGLKLKLYGSALKLLRDIEQSCSSKMAFNIFLLRNKIQENIKANEKAGKRPLDLYEFISNTSIVQAMKQKMIEQADLQIKLCQEQLNKKPNLLRILENSQQIEMYRQSMSKEVAKAMSNIPEYFIEPMLVSAYYHLRLNFSSSGSFRVYEAFSRKYKKYSNLFRADTLCQENLYDKNKVVLTLRTNLENLGTIANCSKSAEQILGRRTENLKGRSFGLFMPSVLAECFTQRLKNYIQSEGKSGFNDIIRSFARNKSNFLIQVDYYFGVHPFITDELYLDLILRPVPSSKEYMIVDKDGVIQAGTEGISKKLGLNKPGGAKMHGMTVSSLSEDLKQLNQACDTIAYHNYQENNWNWNKSDIGMKSGPNMSLEQAQMRLERLQVDGQMLSFSSKNENVEYVYYCNVEFEVHPTVYFKVFTFEEVEGEVQSIDKLHKKPEKNLVEIKQTSIEYISPKIAGNTKTTDVDDQEDFKLDCEKEAGWIDLGRFNSETEGLCSGRGLLTIESSINKISPRKVGSSEKERLLRIHFPGSIPEQEQSKEMSQAISIPEKSMDIPEKPMSQGGKTGARQHVSNVMKIRHSLAGSQTSLSSEHEKVENMFSDALNVNYYPKMYKLYIPAVYILLLALLIARIILQLESNQALVLINGRRVILGNAESASDFIGRIQRNIRLITNYNQGVMNETEYAKYSASTKSLLDAITLSLGTLGKANQDLFSATSSISTGDRNEVFANNIPVYESYYNEALEISPSLNIFQAATRIYESGIRATNIARTNVTKAIPEYKFILRNSLNDFLIAGRKTSDLLYRMSLKEINASLDTTLGMLIAIQVSIVMIILASAMVTFRQYQSETRNLEEFVGIRREPVELLLTKMIEFKTLLEEGGSFENARPIALAEYLSKFINNKPKGMTTRQNKESNSTGIFVKYFLEFLRLSAIFLLLSGFSIGAYIQNSEIFDFTKTKLSQIFFTRRVLSNAGLSITIFIELFSENNRTLIENKPPASQFDDIVTQVSSMITQIPAVLTVKDSSYDKTVYNLLYKDGCSFLTEKAARTRCIGGLAGRNILNVMSSISDLESGLIIANDAYKQSNKTDEVLRNLMYANFPGVIFPGRAVTELLNFTAYTLDQGFKDVIAQVKKEKDTLDIVIEVVVVASGVVVWAWVLRKLIEAENKFKKVLKTLPENLIMSNFVLKAYLFRTSKSFLASIRNKD